MSEKIYTAADSLLVQQEETIHQLQAEIARLKKQLEEARKDALEEAANVCDDLAPVVSPVKAKKNTHQWTAYRSAQIHLNESANKIRALKDGE